MLSSCIIRQHNFNQTCLFGLGYGLSIFVKELHSLLVNSGPHITVRTKVTNKADVAPLLY